MMRGPQAVEAGETFEDRTRSVFDRHHRDQNADERIFQRLVGLIDEAYFGFEPGRLAGLRTLDAGCGSNGNCSFALLAQGAAHVTALDLGDAWIAPVSERLASFPDRFACVPGSVLDLPFDDQRFDFVHCAGVLHHTADPHRGFRELARTVAPDGHLFVSIMGNANGVIYKCINLLRAEYASNPEFRAVVDGLNGEKLKAGVDWLISEKSTHEPELRAGENEVFASLFDHDLVLTILDRLQAPTYHNFDFTELQIRAWFEQERFCDIRRLTRYTYGFGNLRRFLAPMYLHHDAPASRLWLGDGYIQMIGRRPD